jgi:predicted RNA-binding protein with PUA-like domain
LSGEIFGESGIGLLRSAFGIATICGKESPHPCPLPEGEEENAAVAKKNSMQSGWLFKEEPSCYSYADLEKDGGTWWTGVTNALARKHLRSISVGDRVLFYHTGKERQIVGEMRVVEGPTTDPKSDDPKSVRVKVAPVKCWDRPVSLEEIKQDPTFADWELVRISRLSVMPVSPVQWQRLEELSHADRKTD